LATERLHETTQQQALQVKRTCHVTIMHVISCLVLHQQQGATCYMQVELATAEKPYQPEAQPTILASLTT
jgi:hypothetical protein